MTINRSPGRRRALISGGSLGGLFAGTLLNAGGWDVHILERSPHDLSSQGAGLVQQAELTRALRAAGVEQLAPLGVTALERVTLDRSGAVLQQSRARQTQFAWDGLYRELRARFPDARYHLGASVAGVRQDEDSLHVTLEDGRALEGDLLVAADGTLSTVRGLLLPHLRPSYAGYVAWRGLVPERQISERTREALAGRFGFYRFDGSHILGYLIPGPAGETREGARRYNWVWYRQAAAGTEIDRLLTDRQGVRRPISMPPEAMDPEVEAEMRRAAAELLPPPFADAVAATDAPFIQAIQDLVSPEMALGRVALIGDAAAVVRPHTAMGVDKAAGDAFELARVLTASGGDVPAALAAWAPRRQAHAEAVADYGRRLGAPLESEALDAR